MTPDGQADGLYAPRWSRGGRAVQTRLGTLTVEGGPTRRRRASTGRAALVLLPLALAAVAAIGSAGAALYQQGWMTGYETGVLSCR